jgi:undecaprenyl-diphosphatase
MFTFIILGIIEGFTEFLPISSTGHLILARYFFGLETTSPLAVDAILQLGAILAVYIYFGPELWAMIKDFFQKKQHLVWAIVIATIPALLIGIVVEKYIDLYLRTPSVVAIVLIVGAVLFLFVEHFYKNGQMELKKISLKQALSIGVAQCLAFFPGFSRSGATIMAGQMNKLTREAAARFSFYLSIPIITLSGLKKLYDVLKVGLPQGIGMELAVGTITAFVVAIISIHFLLNFLKKHGLNLFAYYRIVLGLIVLIQLM